MPKLKSKSSLLQKKSTIKFLNNFWYFGGNYSKEETIRGNTVVLLKEIIHFRIFGTGWGKIDFPLESHFLFILMRIASFQSSYGKIN